MIRMEDELLFLKLGGSLITDKDHPRTARLEVIHRLASEIAEARAANPALRILLGHGSGSYGHTAARKYGTRQGVHNPQGWAGFAEVWREARALDQIVIDALVQAGLPCLAFPPSAFMLLQDGKVAAMEWHPLAAALDHGLVPVVQGDVAFDTVRGGTILSTEDVFVALAPLLKPRRILLAGVEPGVWADYPACTHLVKTITPGWVDTTSEALAGSASVDVTGGMREKVLLMLELARALPGLETGIFSGMEPGSVRRALVENTPGTLISL
jgi:isopentenyl phosphate kinase